MKKYTMPIELYLQRLNSIDRAIAAVKRAQNLCSYSSELNRAIENLNLAKTELMMEKKHREELDYET